MVSRVHDGQRWLHLRPLLPMPVHCSAPGTVNIYADQAPAATYILSFAGNCAVRTIVESIDGCGASATSRWRNCLRCVRDSNAHMSQDSRQRRLQPESTYGDTCSPTSVGTDPQRAVATTYADIAESSSKVTQSRHDQTTSSPEQMPDSGITVDPQSLMAVLHPEHARVILCKKIRSPRRSSNLSYSNLCSARLSNTRSAWKPILTTVATYAQTAASPSSMGILCYWPNKEIKWNDSWARQLMLMMLVGLVAMQGFGTCY